MECREARRILWPADSPRLSDADVEAALSHAECCSSCEFFLEEDRRLARLVRGTMRRATAPRDLRERLYTALARERAGVARKETELPRSHRALGVAGLLLATLALGLTAHLMTRHAADSAEAATFAEDYLRRAVEQDELLSSDRDRIAVFFARELGVNITPPDVPQFEVSRATICLLNGQRGGVVEYESGPLRLSHYLLPLAGIAPNRLADERSANPANQPGLSTGLSSQRGLGVATWRDAQHQHALVGNLPTQKLQNLAPLFACPGSRL